jgi:hypothetical protein
MLAKPERSQLPPPPRGQGIQERLERILGNQLVRILSLEAQLEEAQAELVRLRQPVEEPK